jgi:hypothetical protein
LAAEAVNRGLSMAFGLAGVLILFAVLAHLAARRQGGWRVVRRRLRREAALTATAFAAPVQTRLRYRRHLRLLVRLLRQPAGWADAERALLRAEAVRADVRAYAALLGTDVVGVLVACGSAEPPQPPAPWVTDVLDPRLWWIDRTDVTERAARVNVRDVAPLLVALGVDDEHALLAVLLDLTSGPAAVAVDGEPRTARAVLQSLTAQLDARLPAGALTVADGVHDQYAGPDATTAVAAAERRAASADGPAFAVCAAAPQGRRLPDGVQLIAAGGVRGLARLLTTRRDGGLLVHGTPLRVDAISLPRAVARIIGELPPYPAPGGPVDDLAEPPLPAHRAARRSADSAQAEPPRPDARPAAVSAAAASPGAGRETSTARSAGDGTAGTDAPVADDLTEPEAPTRLAGVSSTETP